MKHLRRCDFQLSDYALALRGSYSKAFSPVKFRLEFHFELTILYARRGVALAAALPAEEAPPIVDHAFRTYTCRKIVCDLYSGRFTLSQFCWVSRRELTILYTGHRALTMYFRATGEFHREDGRRVMKTRLSVRRFSGGLVILAMAAICLAWNLPSLNAQAAAPAGPPTPPPTAENMKGKTASQFYKKVEVLKDIPATEIHPAMEYITLALGVGCPYCHTIGKFDVDDKREKHVARSMIAMTMALNATVFDNKREITCYTCHRGAAKGAPTLVFPGEKSPTEKTAAEIFPALAVRNITGIDPSMAPSMAPATVVSGPAAPAPPPPAPVASLPATEDVFAKYLQALGGNAAIGKITSVVHKGTVEMLVPAPPGPPGTPPVPPAMGTVPAEFDRKLPGKQVVSLQFPGRPANMTGFDGVIGWHGAPLREDTGGELGLLKEMAEFPPALKFREDHTKVQVDAMEKINGHDVYRVVGSRPDGSAIDRLYFDAQSGLLLRSYTTMQSVLGSFPEETNYDDYRDVSGVKIPYAVLVVSAEGNRTYKWAQIDANTPVDDSKFTKPLPPPPPPKPAD